MPRMRILNISDQERFDKPPIFNSLQRKKFFTFTKIQLAEVNEFRKPASKIGFFLAWGYFSATKKFFLSKDFHTKDIEYVSRLISTKEEVFKAENYPNSTRLRHEHSIMEYFGYRRFSESKDRVLKDINQMVHDQLKPKLIFGRSVDLLLQAKVQLPSSYKLSECIIESLNNHQNHLETIVQENITPEIQTLLDDLFMQESSSKTSRYRLTLLKKISQSTKPTKVKERVEDLKYLADLYGQLYPVISKMNLKHEGIKYFAGSVLKSQVFQLRQRSDEDRYVHSIAFVAHQYYRLQDNLAEVLLSVVRTYQNTVQREHKDRCYEQRKTHKQHLSSFLERLDKDFFTLVKEIRNLSHDVHLSDTNKVLKIKDLLGERDKCEDLKVIKSELEAEMNPVEYYRILESRSVRLQNRVSPIIKSLDFQAEPGAAKLMDAIQYFKLKDGIIKHDSQIEFLDEEQRKIVMIEQKINPSLYKAFMFIHIANAIKSGTLNLKYSYKYRPLDDYIIGKERWNKEKGQLIRQAGLEKFTDCYNHTRSHQSLEYATPAEIYLNEVSGRAQNSNSSL